MRWMRWRKKAGRGWRERETEETVAGWAAWTWAKRSSRARGRVVFWVVRNARRQDTLPSRCLLPTWQLATATAGKRRARAATNKRGCAPRTCNQGYYVPPATQTTNNNNNNNNNTDPPPLPPPRNVSSILFSMKNAFAFLVGTKYDLFCELDKSEQADITKQAKKFAKAMKAPLIFSSSSHAINVQKTFKIVLSQVFNLKCTIPKITKVGDPILIF